MEPFNFSKVIGQKIDFEMQRLGWTTNQEQEYLIKTYGKRSRSLLTEEELLYFLNCFRTQSISAILWEILIARIHTETEQLGWTQEYTREHLIKNYDKRTLSLLTEIELLDFLKYLTTSQPAPKLDDEILIAQTHIELRRLGWTLKQASEHLIKTYGKQGCLLLTYEESHEFLKYLQSQPDPLG